MTHMQTRSWMLPEKDTFLGAENPFESMMARFDEAAHHLNLEPGLRLVLRHPEKQLIVGVRVGGAVVRAAYEQIGNTVALWADTGVDKQVGGWTIPMSWFISLNPLF